MNKHIHMQKIQTADKVIYTRQLALYSSIFFPV